jgi:hypothetical protein
VRLRGLNDAGRLAFLEYLQSARETPRAIPPWHLLESDDSTYAIGRVDIESKTFQSRSDLAVYLATVLEALPPATVSSDIGLWAWLTLLYFDTVAPPDNQGSRKILKDPSRYLPEYSKRNAYRHLLRSRYRLYRLHRDNPSRTRLLSHGPVHVWSDLEEQIYGVMELIRLPGALECADLLYFDPEAGQAKRGVTNRKRGGTVRRLGLFIQQLDRTYDVYAMSGTEIAALLPAEFHRFLPPAP